MAAVIALNYFFREMKIYELRYREKNMGEWDKVYRNSAVGAENQKN
jgi:hypothetical protein